MVLDDKGQTKGFAFIEFQEEVRPIIFQHIYQYHGSCVTSIRKMLWPRYPPITMSSRGVESLLP
jgi:hypothetical protein